MKKILKILLVPVFVSTSSLTVVACGTNSTRVWPEDILNSAVGRMQNHMFSAQDLGIAAMPQDQRLYGSLPLLARARITNYYSDLVKAGNWDYPTVSVRVTANGNNSPFFNPYKNRVESRITLTTHLSYKNLTQSKDITVKIDDENENSQVKITAISEYLTEYLATNPVFNFSSLFQDGLKSDDPNVNWAQIEAPLRFGILRETTKENPFPVIDVADVNLAVVPIAKTDPAKVLYQLDTNSLTAESTEIKGTLQNLTLMLRYKEASKEVAAPSLAIAQKISDTNNQVARILNKNPGALSFTQTALPENGQTLSEYSEGAALQENLAATLFADIEKIYPTAKMNAGWTASQITVDNPESSVYVKGDKGDENTFGHFLVNIKFEFKLEAGDEKLIIATTVYGIQLNLKKG